MHLCLYRARKAAALPRNAKIPTGPGWRRLLVCPAAANEEAELAVAKARSLGLLADESISPLAPAPAPWMSGLRRHISNGIDRARLEMICRIPLSISKKA